MIYLDSAATTLPKPAAVGRAMLRAVNTLASPGRGGHPAARAAARLAFTCREEAAALFGLGDPEQVVFTSSATHGLNLAIRSIVREGGCVLISGYEHNAVTRVLHAIPGLRIRVADAPLFRPEEMLQRFDDLMTEEVSAVICTHVSNVFGYILPVEQIAALCRARGVRLIIDASQSAGCLPVNAGRWQADFVAMPGHKGLYGPQGTGLLLCAAGTAEPLLMGGTGSSSERQEMPEFLPDRLEPGTHNMPGIAGLLEGIRFVSARGVERIGAQERELIRRLGASLAELAGVRVFTAEPGQDCQSGVLSLLIDGIDCEEAGELLARRGFAVRCGLHCAPLAHRTAGTAETGTVRVSVSAFNTVQQIDRLAGAIGELAGH